MVLFAIEDLVGFTSFADDPYGKDQAKAEQWEQFRKELEGGFDTCVDLAPDMDLGEAEERTYLLEVDAFVGDTLHKDVSLQVEVHMEGNNLEEDRGQEQVECLDSTQQVVGLVFEQEYQSLFEIPQE